jgi:DNA-3-methyladenine glycosylase II
VSHPAQTLHACTSDACTSDARTSDACTSDTQTIQTRSPFSFRQALAFLGRFPPTLGERAVIPAGGAHASETGAAEGGAVLGAARLEGQTIGFRVSAAPVAGAAMSARPERRDHVTALACEFFPADQSQKVTAGTSRALLRRIGAWLGASDDLGPFYALAEADLPFQVVVDRLYGYHQVRFFTPFENTCWAILGQRTPRSVARAAKRGLMTRYAGTATVQGQTFLAFPEPADLAASSVNELTEIVNSPRKAERLHRIAQAFAETGPAALDAMPTDDLMVWLRALPGIGPWSVVFIVLRGFGRPDAPLQLGAAATFDRELLTAARAVYGRDLTEPGLAQIIERYAGWQGYWGHYLRVAS